MSHHHKLSTSLCRHHSARALLPLLVYQEYQSRGTYDLTRAIWHIFATGMMCAAQTNDRYAGSKQRSNLLPMSSYFLSPSFVLLVQSFLAEDTPPETPVPATPLPLLCCYGFRLRPCSQRAFVPHYDSSYHISTLSFTCVTLAPLSARVMLSLYRIV